MHALMRETLTQDFSQAVSLSPEHAVVERSNVVIPIMNACDNH